MALPLSPATLAAVAAALVVVVLLVAFIIRQRAQASAGVLGGAAGGSGKRKAADSVVLVGPTGSGKTVLLHQIMRGKTPETVMSMKPATLRGKPLCAAAEAAAGGGSSVPTLQLVDLPGHPQLKASVLEAAGRAAGIVFVVDASAPYDATPSNHFRAAADLLYDLFTSPAIVGSPPPLLVALNKADAPGARGVEPVKAILETELERLKVTRPSVATEAGGDDDGGAGGAAPLLLGAAGQHFRFDADAPCAVSWCSCVAAGSDGGGGADDDGDGPLKPATGSATRKAAVGDVEAFVCDVVAGRA